MSVHELDKFSPRAVRTVFLGYSVTQKGYKLYDPISKTFHFSRHVIFDESVFPYATTNSQCSEFLYTPPDLSCDDALSHLVVTDEWPAENHKLTTQSSGNLFSDSVIASESIIPSVPCDTVTPPSPVPVVPSRVSLRKKIAPVWMKDYVAPTAPTVNAASVSAILLQCPIDSKKYNFSHYSPPSSTIYACAVSSQTTIPEPFNYNQAVKDD